MKVSKLALSAIIAGACLGGTAFGQTNRSAPRFETTSYQTQAPAPITSATGSSASAVVPASACCEAGPASCDIADICNGKGAGCDAGSSCDGLGGGCGGGGLLSGLFGECCLGEPWKLVKEPIAGFNIGGWSSVGYHSHRNPNSFNNYDNKVQLGQQWFYAERVADGSQGLGIGGRIDYLYGTDAPDTQAFGTPGRFDDNWDNGGAYGHALPQVYGEVAMGDLSVKLGRFFTIVGNEVVAATGNFFYSRQFTFYNAEPFTHTGALATYKIDDDNALYGGYVLGWDSGFDDNGDAYLGGFKRKLNDDVSLILGSCLGRFGDTTAGERGSVHSAILTANLTDKLTYINQTDVLFTRDAAGAAFRNTFGNINYLIYKVNDCVSFGQRFEWFNFSGNSAAAGPTNLFAGRDNDDLYNYTMGLNLRRSANLVFRPEVRWVWDKTAFGFNEDNNQSQAAFGGDMVFTF
jgi:hypothetical protein